MFCKVPSASDLVFLKWIDFTSDLVLLKLVFSLDLIMIDFLDVFVIKGLMLPLIDIARFYHKKIGKKILFFVIAIYQALNFTLALPLHYKIE